MRHLWPIQDQIEYRQRQSTSAQGETARLESEGWRVWYAAVFGQKFIDALDSSETDDRHHSEAIEWHWQTRRALIALELEANNLRKLQETGVISESECAAKLAAQEGERETLKLAFFTIWARGNMKTTIARRVAVCDACLTSGAGLGGFCLAISGTKVKIRSTANSIAALLTRSLSQRGSEVWKYYPKLAEVKRSKFGHSQGWTTDFINTAAGYIFQFVGLDEGMAGANEEDIRPTFILPDDIDNRKDSPVIAERNFQTFTTEVLPMRQWNTLVFFAQNLISRYSVMYRIWKQQVRVLTNRLITEPIPAVRNLVTEVRTVGGIVKDIFVSGKVTWRGWSPQRVQEEIDTYGLPAFSRECQHDVEDSREGLVLQNWNDEAHVITWADFERVFKCPEIPRHWNKYVVNDWARTKTQYHANVAFTVAVSAQNSQLPGCYFVFNPYSFPAGSSPEDVAERILSGIAPSVRLENGRSSTWRELIKNVLQKTELESHSLTTTELIDARRNVLADILPLYVDPILKAQTYVQFRGSHEQSKTGALAVYRKVFGLPFNGVNPGGDGGVDSINLAQRVDYELPHPIKPIKGYTRFFLVVDDKKAEYPHALSPTDLIDSDLFRFQMANWRVRDPYLTAKGETEGELLKLNDDFGNGLMMLFYDGMLSAAPLAYHEKVEEAMPERHRKILEQANHGGLSPEDELTLLFAINRAKQMINDGGIEDYDEWGDRVA